MILETALTCLALNIYHEARSQSLVEQLAVSQVVMNRVADSRFPSTGSVRKASHIKILTNQLYISVNSRGTVMARVTSLRTIRRA